MPGSGGDPRGVGASASTVPGTPGRPNAPVRSRVLDEAPAAILVVDEVGCIEYGNSMLAELTGWRLDEARGQHILAHIHPDDQAWVIEAFEALTATADEHVDAGRTRWAPVLLRLRCRDGSYVPVEVTGTGRLHDPDIHGLVYHVRPAWTSQTLGAIHRGMASGVDEVELLRLVVDLIAAPPLDLQAVVLRPTGLGRHEIVIASDERLGSAFDAVDGPLPWPVAPDPVSESVAQIPGALGESLVAAGFADLWHVGVEAKMTSSTYRIVACSDFHHVPSSGVAHRLRQAQELAAVVLLRSQAELLLAHGAFHDHLTQLPNRAGLLRQVSTAVSETRAVMLYVDLDEFKPINDRHGHDAGDAVLQEVAARLRAECRADDSVARVGGDEFVLVLALDQSDEERMRRTALDAAERIARAVSGPIEVGDVTVQVSASVGAVVSELGQSTQELMTRADAAMFVAKRQGGNRGHLD